MAKTKARADQEYLPGTAPVKNERVHKAAQHYVKCRDTRIAANKEEKEAHETLLGYMNEAGLTDYEYKDVSVHVDVDKKCKVSNPKDKKASADSNGEAEE